MTQLFNFLPPQSSGKRHTTNSNYKRPKGRRTTNVLRECDSPGNGDFNGAGSLVPWPFPVNLEHGGSLACTNYLKH